MVIEKKEFSAPDAQQITLYAKRDGDSQKVFPVLATSSGSLLISGGMDIPSHDWIDLTYDSSSNLETVKYRNGGSTGTIVATVLMTYSSNNLVSVALV